MRINEIQDEIIEEFSAFDDWMDKYQLLIDTGSDQEPLPEKYKTEQNLIDGCQIQKHVFVRRLGFMLLYPTS